MNPVRATLLFSFCVLAPRLTAQNEVDRIRERVQAALAVPGAVGLSIAVARGNEILFEDGVGSAELEHDVPANAETMFRIGSVTKQFTAAAIVRLSEEDKVDLDEDMRTFLSEYPELPQVVTVRHLLTHTSGIQSYTGLGPEWRKTVAKELSHQELLALFQNKPLEFAPGEGWKYNNSGYYLLGMIIEAVSDLGYDQYLAQEFFAPLGLTRTRYGSNFDLIKNRAQGYRYSEGTLYNDDLIGMSQPGAAGALLSTAGDLVRWQLALISGKVVDDSSYEEMTTPYLLMNNRETNYGFGLIMDEVEGHRRVSHGGGIHGFNSILAYYPDVKLSIAVISNSEGYSADRLGRELARTLLNPAIEATSQR